MKKQINAEKQTQKSKKNKAETNILTETAKTNQPTTGTHRSCNVRKMAVVSGP